MSNPSTKIVKDGSWDFDRFDRDSWRGAWARPETLPIFTRLRSIRAMGGAETALDLTAAAYARQGFESGGRADAYM